MKLVMDKHLLNSRGDKWQGIALSNDKIIKMRHHCL